MSLEFGFNFKAVWHRERYVTHFQRSGHELAASLVLKPFFLQEDANMWVAPAAFERVAQNYRFTNHDA